MAQFSPSDEADLFYTLTGILWILSEIVGSYIIPSLRRRGKKIEKRDRGSRSGIVFGWKRTSSFLNSGTSIYNIRRGQ